jgi:hypothetical protein
MYILTKESRKWNKGSKLQIIQEVETNELHPLLPMYNLSQLLFRNKSLMTWV